MASSTKRSWKLQDFVAHGSNVRCLGLGHKSGRVLVTGGDDKLVNLWAVGKQNCIMSLSGNAYPIECVQFGNTEELVVSGDANGSLRIWDLEAAKMIRTLQGHKGAIRCTHFHPYGDFITTGSVDKEVKLWDIRRKGCIYSYTNHKLTVNSVKFSPDGKWIASGSDDGTIKLWDLRAGEMLKEFVDPAEDGSSTSARGALSGSRPITLVEFHPHEFLLASGTTHRVVRFWDLESLTLVSTSDCDPSQIAPVRCLLFAESGECLYCGSEDSLRVLGWEPAITYHSIPIGWAQVKDLAFAQNQLIGASFHSTNVVLYVVDLRGFPHQWTAVRAHNVITPETARAFLSNETCTEASIASPPGVLNTSTGSNSPFSHGQSVRKSFSKERPPPGSKHRIVVKTTEESDKSGTDPEDEMQSIADIKDVGDYQAIFQPNRALARTPPPAPFPAPWEKDPCLPQVLQSPSVENLFQHHSLESTYSNSEPVKESGVRNNRMPSPRKEPFMRRNSIKDPQPQPKSQEADFPFKVPSVKHRSEPALNKASSFHSRSSSLSRTFVGVQTSSGAKSLSAGDSAKNPPSPMSTKGTSHSLPPYSPNKLNQNLDNHSASVNISGQSPRGLPQRHSQATGISRPPSAPTSSPRVLEDPPVQYFGQPSYSAVSPDIRSPIKSFGEKPFSHKGNFINPALDVVTSRTYSHRVEDEDFIVPMSSDKPSDLDMSDFLPRTHRQFRLGMHMGGGRSSYPDLSEGEIITKLIDGNETVLTVLKNRHRALQVIYSIWNTKDMKTAIDTAVELEDLSVIVDILGVLNLKPLLWNLDLCVSMLPSIHNLLQSRYEMYMRVGVDALRLILRNFTPVIRTHITGPAPIGVDIPREERYKKCMTCYEHLVSIRSFLLKRQTLQGKLGQSFRELHVQMQNLDSSN